MSFHKPQGFFGLRRWIVRKFVYEKLNNPMGYTVALLGAFALAFLLSKLPLSIAMLGVAALIGIPVILICFINLHFGVNMMLVAGFLLGLVAKYTNAPIGTALDGLLVLMLVGLLARLIKEKDFSFAKSPISIFIAAWIYYNLLEVINPWAASKIAWVYTVRTVALLLALYFIACYAFSSYKRILTTVKLIIFLAFISALYSIKQEFHWF